MKNNKAVVLELDGNIDLTPVSAYDAAKTDGYLGSEEQYAQEMAAKQITQEYFDAIPGRLCKMYNTTDKSSFHQVADSSADKITDFGLEGKTEQATYSGKNLLKLAGRTVVEDKNTSNTSKRTLTGNGIFVGASYSNYLAPGNVNSYSVTENSIKINTKNNAYGIGFDMPVEGKTVYSYSSTNMTDYAAAAYYDVDGNYLSGTTSLQALKRFTTPENAKWAIIVFYTPTSNADISFGNPMIEKGASASSEFEIYVGGAPSPNPEYPQEIVNAGVYNEATGRYEIGCEIKPKNLFNLAGREIDTNDGHWSGGTDKRNFTGNKVFIGLAMSNVWSASDITSYNITEDTITLNGKNANYGLAFDFKVEKGQQYYISATGDVNIDIGLYDKDGYYKSYMWDNGDIRFTIPDGIEWINIIFSCVEANRDNIITNIQLELSGNKTEYEFPYQSQQVTLTSPVPITKWDYLTKRDGVWGWSVRSLQILLDGDYTWGTYENNPVYAGFQTANITYLPTTNRRDGYCNQLRVNTRQTAMTDGLWIGAGNKALYLINNSFYDSTLDDKGLSNWKAHLNEIPLEVWTYADNEQSFHPLPEAEQTLLNNLETYYGVTNVYNDQGCSMWLTYSQDTKLAIDNKFNNIKQAIISLGGNV